MVTNIKSVSMRKALRTSLFFNIEVPPSDEDSKPSSDSTAQITLLNLTASLPILQQNYERALSAVVEKEEVIQRMRTHFQQNTQLNEELQKSNFLLSALQQENQDLKQEYKEIYQMLEAAKKEHFDALEHKNDTIEALKDQNNAIKQMYEEEIKQLRQVIVQLQSINLQRDQNSMKREQLQYNHNTPYRNCNEWTHQQVQTKLKEHKIMSSRVIYNEAKIKSERQTPLKQSKNKKKQEEIKQIALLQSHENIELVSKEKQEQNLMMRVCDLLNEQTDICYEQSERMSQGSENLSFQAIVSNKFITEHKHVRDDISSFSITERNIGDNQSYNSINILSRNIKYKGMKHKISQESQESSKEDSKKKTSYIVVEGKPMIKNKMKYFISGACSGIAVVLCFIKLMQRK